MCRECGNSPALPKKKFCSSCSDTRKLLKSWREFLPEKNCMDCGESYPAGTGNLCRQCKKKSPPPYEPPPPSYTMTAVSRCCKFKGCKKVPLKEFDYCQEHSFYGTLLLITGLTDIPQQKCDKCGVKFTKGSSTTICLACR